MELPSESYRSDPHPDFPSIGDGQIIMKIHAPEITIAISIAIMSTSIGFIAVGNLSTWCGSNDVVRLDLCRNVVARLDICDIYCECPEWVKKVEWIVHGSSKVFLVISN